MFSLVRRHLVWTVAHATATANIIPNDSSIYSLQCNIQPNDKGLNSFSHKRRIGCTCVLFYYVVHRSIKVFFYVPIVDSIKNDMSHMKTCSSTLRHFLSEETVELMIHNDKCLKCSRRDFVHPSIDNQSNIELHDMLQCDMLTKYSNKSFIHICKGFSRMF